MTSNLSLNLQLEQLLEKIKVKKARSVLIQLPDGLKPRADEIQRIVRKNFPQVKLTFWAGSCYGACDVPNVQNFNQNFKNDFDLVVQFGHSAWTFN